MQDNKILRQIYNEEKDGKLYVYILKNSVLEKKYKTNTMLAMLRKHGYYFSRATYYRHRKKAEILYNSFKETDV